MGVVIKHKWIVFTAAFMTAFLNFGFAISMGAMYTGLLDTFGAGRARTALVQSLVASFCFGFGVVGVFLISKFGIRVVSFTAALLTATGFFLSYFATSIYQLYGFISVITGIGLSTMYVAAVLCLESEFTGSQKSIVLATQCIGTALSGFMWPFLLTASIEAYSVRGTFLILGGIFLNNIPLAIIFSNCKVIIDTEKTERTQTYASAARSNETDTDGKITNEQDDSKHIFHVTSLRYTARHSSTGNTTTYPSDKEVKENNSKRETIHTEKQNINATKRNNVTNNCGNKCSKLCCSTLVWIYALFVLSGILILVAMAGLQAVYQDINTENGLTISQSDLSFLSYSTMNVLSRFLHIIPAKLSFINVFAVPLVASLSGAFGQVVILTRKSFTGAIVGMGLTAVADGGLVSSIQTILFQILPQKYQAFGFGFMFTAVGVSTAPIGPLFGSMRDSSTSYQTVIISSATVMFVSAVLCSILFIIVCKVFTERL